MSRVFVSHKWEEKIDAKKLKAYLESCFISCWLDESNLQAGGVLTNEILKAINESQCLMAMVSERYLDSPYCKLEFDYAFHQMTKHNYKIIILTLGDRQQLIEKAKQKGLLQLVFLLEGDNCKPLNQYDSNPVFQSVASAITQNDAIKFNALKNQTIDGQQLQIIEIIAPNVPTDIFKTLDLAIEDYISIYDTDNKLIKRNIPVALFGRTAAWVYAHIAMSFYNKCDVFIFNSNSNDYICIYSLKSNKEKFKGMVLKP